MLILQQQHFLLREQLGLVLLRSHPEVLLRQLRLILWGVRMYNSSTHQGFTLVEVMISVVIVSVGVLALQTFYGSIIRSQQLSQERLVAVHMAEQVIEGWQNSSTDALPSISCTTGTQQLVAGTATVCTSTSGIQTEFTVLATSTTAKAPLPPSHPNGVAGSVVYGDMNGATSGVSPYAWIVPKIKTVTVSWAYKGETKSVMLTHLTQWR